jgi:hypothetical protein
MVKIIEVTDPETLLKYERHIDDAEDMPKDARLIQPPLTPGLRRAAMARLRMSTNPDTIDLMRVLGL